MNIPIAKPYLDESDAQAAYDTILTGWVSQGPKVQEFEEKFAAYVNSKYAVAVSSCTTALHLAFVVAGIGKGDEVICPSMSYIATANSIVYTGATPVFAEVNPHTYNLEIEDVEKRITKNTKAILLVHQIGLPADINGFKELCSKHNLLLIEDAACAIGASYKGEKIGSHSDLVCFSFHPRKVITTGDGGMISTSNKEYYEHLKMLRQHAMSINDRIRHESRRVIFEEYPEIGYNYRMTDIQAAIGIQQLNKLDNIIKKRRELAAKYIKELSDVECIRLPYEPDGYISNFQSFSIYVKPNCPVSRDELIQKLLNEGISTRRGIMTAHRETAYQNRGKISLPVTEDTADNSLLLPLYYSLTDEEISFVIKCIRSILIHP